MAMAPGIWIAWANQEKRLARLSWRTVSHDLTLRLRALNHALRQPLLGWVDNASMPDDGASTCNDAGAYRIGMVERSGRSVSRAAGVSDSRLVLVRSKNQLYTRVLQLFF